MTSMRKSMLHQPKSRPRGYWTAGNNKGSATSGIDQVAASNTAARLRARIHSFPSRPERVPCELGLLERFVPFRPRLARWYSFSE